MLRISTAAIFCAISLFRPVQASRDWPVTEQWKERARDADERLRRLKTTMEAAPKDSAERKRLWHDVLLQTAFAAHLNPEMADKVHGFDLSNGIETFALEIYANKEETFKVLYNYRGTKLVSAQLVHLPKNWSTFFKTGEETKMLVDDERGTVFLIDLREPLKSIAL